MGANLADPRIARGMAAQNASRVQRVAEGGKLIGWKVGFGAPAAMEKLRLENPLVGYLLESGIVESGASVSLKDWTKPVAEPEICIEMGADLPGGASVEKVMSAIAAVGPAIELADLTFVPDDVEKILSDNIFQRHVIFGERDRSRRGGNISGLTGIVTRNGSAHASTTDLEANTGAILGIVRDVADLLDGLGGRLRAGEIIICGSVVPPIFVEPSDQSIDFDLQPLGSVSVRFR